MSRRRTNRRLLLTRLSLALDRSGTWYQYYEKRLVHDKDSEGNDTSHWETDWHSSCQTHGFQYKFNVFNTPMTIAYDRSGGGFFTASQHGRSAVWAVPPLLGSCASSGRAWRLWAARCSQGKAGPLGAQPVPRLLELVAFKVADSTAFDRPGAPAVAKGASQLGRESRHELPAAPGGDSVESV